MTYGSQFSPDAARHNHIDARTNGILDYDNRNDWNQGQAALDYGSGTGIEFSVDGANFLINGSKVGAPSNSVQISDGHDSLWRTDHIYASEDGAYNVLEGEPGSNEYLTHEIADAEMVASPPDNVLEDTFEEGDVVHLRHENTQAGGPAPKGQEFARKRGEPIFSILVPPGASDIAQFGSAYVLDRRRPAIDLLNTDRPRSPPISSESFTLEPKSWEFWHLGAWENYTLRLWDYALSQLQFGFFTTSNFKLYLVDLSKRPGHPDQTVDYNDGDVDWSEMAVWESEQSYQPPSPDDPIVDIDIPEGSVEPFLFVVENTSEYTYAEHRTLSLSVTYTLDPTGDL